MSASAASGSLADPHTTRMTSTNKQHDISACLMSMPPELLHHVFSFLSPVPRAQIARGAPTCRTLLPYFRRILYRTVVLDGFMELLSFLRATASSAILLGAIEDLTLKAKPAEAAPHFSQRQVNGTFLAKLSRVRVLRIASVAAFAEAVFHPIKGLEEHDRLPCLEHLVLTEVFRGNGNPFTYAALNSYPRLRRLEVNIAGPFYKALQLPPEAPPPTPPSFKTIVSFHFVGDLTECRTFLPWFPNLTVLRLVGAGTPASQLPHYDALEVATRSIEHLHLRLREETSTLARFMGLTPPESSPIDLKLLERFAQLSVLHLGQHTFSPEILADLHKFPNLRTLGFGRRTPVKLDNIVSVLEGPFKIKSLKVIDINTVGGVKGRRVDLDEFGDWLEEYDGDMEDVLAKQCGWTLPEWSIKSLNEFELPKLKKIGAEHGVAVRGSAFSAAKIVKEWDDMLADLHEEWDEEGPDLWGDIEDDEDEEEDEDEDGAGGCTCWACLARNGVSNAPSVQQPSPLAPLTTTTTTPSDRLADID